MSVLRKHLTKFRTSQSESKVRQRAKNIELDLVSAKEDQYVFSYEGSYGEPYQIYVELNNGTIHTDCSCPYDWGGLCKHEVAALDYVISNGKFDKEVLPTKSKSIRKTNESLIQLPGHTLTGGVLNDLYQKAKPKYLNSYKVLVLEIKIGQVKTLYDDWNHIIQDFVYDAENQVLSASCSCRASRVKACMHILSALEFLHNRFGPDIFHPEYLNREIEAFLNSIQLDHNLDHKKYFEFSLGSNGLIVNTLAENFVASATIAKNLLPNWDIKEKDNLRLPMKKGHGMVPTHGIGFALQLYSYEGQNSFDLVTFSAKYKKGTTVFTSVYRTIDSYNLLEQMADFGEEDRKKAWDAIELSEKMYQGSGPSSLQAYKEAFLGFKDFLEQRNSEDFFTTKTNRLSKRNLVPLEKGKGEVRLKFNFTESDDFYTLSPILMIEGNAYKASSTRIRVYPYACIKDKKLYPFKTPFDFQYLHHFPHYKEVNFPKLNLSELYKNFIRPLAEHFEVNDRVHSKRGRNAIKFELAKQLYVSDYESEYIVFKPGVTYDGQLIMTHSNEEPFKDETGKLGIRDQVYESDFLDSLRELHPDFENQEPPFFLEPYQLVEDEWLLRTSQKLEKQDIALFGAKELKSFKYSLHRPTVSLGLNSGTDWFDLEVDISFGKERVSLKDVRKAYLKKERYIRLKDGTLGILPQEWLEKLSSYFKVGEVGDDTVKLSNFQFNVIDDLVGEFEETPQFLLELQQLKQRLRNLETVAIPELPKTVKANLRPYQNEGLRWLCFLHQNKLGGCLADDMGLGKTLQTIAFLAFLKQKGENMDTHLIIAPTSLIFNWQEELNKFCPSLKYLIYTGRERDKIVGSFNDNDIVLTTYGTVLKDIEILGKQQFGYLILDESQNIKNPNSKRYKSVRKLKCGNRLALTGTPIENNTFDLFAQMNFLNPGLLGTMAHYRTTFSDPIDKAGNKEASELLGRMVAPFLLRRTKQQVATELPEKTESVMYCEMGSGQRKVYEAFKKKYHDYLINKISENGISRSQMYILEGLTKLRQICNSPELLNEEADYGKEAVKLHTLVNNLKEKVSQHKVLVFSQFTSMLALIKERLENEGIAYSYLDGATRDRAKIVTEFQNDDRIRVFLISLKAGGVGLNLTQADYVFLVDPWWNPAVESQAIDRSYRIGQDKQVMAYKMVCKDTIEEKIIKLQEKKKQVSESIIQTEGVSKSFSEKDIAYLFE